MYNLALETKNAAYIGSKHNYSAFDLIKQLPELKKELPWLKEANSQSLQQSIQNMDIAFKKFFKGAGFPNFKKKSNKGKRNNQNFVQIPHTTFVQILQYKSKLEGINVILQEESYTSKCSFLDGEDVCKHIEYKGKRVKRGLFRTKVNRLINADLNGALNILKKAVGEFQYSIEVCSTPLVSTIKHN